MKKKLTIEESLRLVLENKIEKVLFNEEGLISLKDLIHNVSIGTTTAKTLRESIIKIRGDILEKLLEKLIVIFKFYAHQVSTHEQLSEFTSENNSQVAADLQEKNELLEKVATTVNNMYKKVKKKVELST